MRTRKSTVGKLALLGTMLVTLATYSFMPAPGGDHFEIYLNKKLLFQQIVSQPSGVKSLTLDESNLNDKVEVFYSHCGRVGTTRTIAIKDGNNILKQWRFADVAAALHEKKFMSVNAKDILAFKSKSPDRKLSLYYSSEEIPEGRLLASVLLDTDSRRVEP